ncbi:MAG: HDOD domain-containing protein, partial [Planctomycetota bacterium]
MSSEPHKFKILVVDDEASVRDTIVIILGQSGYETRGIAEARKVEEELVRFKPDLLILDLMLGNVSGLDILARIRNKSDFADLPVIILSAISDKRGIAAASKYRISAYLGKPFTRKAILDKIQEILSGAPTMPTHPGGSSVSMSALTPVGTVADLQDLNRVKDLPAMPFIVSQVSEALRNEKLDARLLANIVEKDQAIVAQLLKIANSAFYGQRGQVKDISQSVVVLGYTEVQNIVVTLALMKSFRFRHKVSGLSPLDFWAHSLGVGILGRQMAKIIGQTNLSDIFIGGVVHDFGKYIINLICPELYHGVMAEVKEHRRPLEDVEREKLDTTHMSVGAQISGRWEFPSLVKNCMRLHHRINFPTIEDAQEIRSLSCVAVGNILARWAGLGDAGNILLESVHPDVWKSLDFQNQKVATEGIDAGIREWARFMQSLGLMDIAKIFLNRQFFELEDEDRRPHILIVDEYARPVNPIRFYLLGSRFKAVVHNRKANLAEY